MEIEGISPDSPITPVVYSEYLAPSREAGVDAEDGESVEESTALAYRTSYYDSFPGQYLDLLV
jgi:hypothetical protein